ncbi:bifunctional protein GlmU [Biomphalaria glabrata]|uniref:Bifunctional protein GlmU-like n=2 Tax=Biomphalaria TaxID=6525 RepID=A0A2C9JYS2_BIOGL|nr:bifunctional protein GlmU-like [Biomphalaria glabrata]KAI8740286.1 bifunctional protein GlmU-like [Biomphalaria glabrata]KAI8784819.1 bifunctional protein GlmU [Biomphalaria glabrata]KAK0039903.1 bifunctional protein GlmU [Biomphalaria pfeifferi]
MCEADSRRHANVASGPLQCHPLRLHPGDELYSTLLHYVRANSLNAAFIMSCVGSVVSADLRMANAEVIRHLEGHYEIVSLVGTLSGGDGGHLHISLSDEHGDVIGGHVMGNLVVYTTAEVIIGNVEGVQFSRPEDPETGYDELMIEKAEAKR